MAKKRSEAPAVPFESVLGELEGLVEKMERGDLSLEESLAAFERGIQLTRTCQEALNQAEQKVEQLLTQDGREQIVPFDAGDA
ncbi:MAG: exodeoxyribonuclease VII small subunit [Gammaproteobacteria bacterium]